MMELTSPTLSPQAFLAYQQAFEFYLTWGNDPASAHAQALRLALEGTGPEAVGPDVFSPAAAPGSGLASPLPPRRRPPAARH
jgi:hypothetical protein